MNRFSMLLGAALLCASAHAQTPVAKPTLHDFAWLAGHWRIEQADGSLLAAIEGPGRDGKGKPRRVEYPFKRVTP